MSSPHIHIQFVKGAVDIQVASTLPQLGCGGECIFIGRTRPESNSTYGDLIALNYDCYIELAQQELFLMTKEVTDRFATRYIQIHHSIGKVAIGEASVVIAVGSEHRGESFLACRYLIDTLKQQVAIWKQELWTGGDTWSKGIPLQIQAQ